MNLYNTNPYGGYPSMYNNNFQQQNQNIYGIKQEVVRVNGKNGADAYQLAPNSSILLLDESAPIVWLKTTDGAGYATVAAYDIVPHQDEIPVDTKSLEIRISKLEEIINELSKQPDVKPTQSTIRKITPIAESKSN